jgi:stress response protein SCP2
MAINLVKGQTINLRKSDSGETFDLSQVTIGLGWDINEKPLGFLGKLFGGGGNDSDFDLDAMAFLLDENDKIANEGKTVTKGNVSVGYHGGDIMFFNSMRHPSGHVWLTGDNRTGEGSGDDEQIIVKLDSLGQQYKRILFFVTIYQGQMKRQHFSMVKNAYIRAVDARGKEITRYSLSGNESLNGMSTLVFGEAYRKDNDWKFRAMGEPHASDLLVDMIKKYSK